MGSSSAVPLAQEPAVLDLSPAQLLALLAREAARASRYGGGGALLLLELDMHASRHEHPETWARTAALIPGLLQRQLRGADQCCVLAADQYACYLPQTDALGAIDAADRLRDAVAQLEASPLQLSASVGVAIWSERGYPALAQSDAGRSGPSTDVEDQVAAQQLWARVQQSLVLARAAGRNCVRAISSTRAGSRGR
ncbi:hypothetical protein ACG0Z6_16225 [Roseateles sp. BYS180W]|uniref:GGDEF domain-containing protein n=1 Tax=Roseateles rivi TaxID=3299028 RepID=A0ABW7FZI3_9BURK